MLTYTMDVLPESIWLRTTPGASAMGQPYVCTEAGQYLAQEHFSTARTHKESYLLFYTLRGAGLIEQGDDRVLLRAGQALLMDCRKPQRYATAPGQHCWHHDWVHLDGAGVAAMAEWLIPEGKLTPITLTDQKVEEQFKTIFAELESGTVDSMLQVSLALHQLLTLCAQGLLNQEQTESNQQVIQQAAQTIREKYNQPLSLNDLLRQAHMSRSYFLRLFRRYMGTTPYNYLISTRITQAKALLALTDRSVSEIGREVGFGDASNFSARFSAAVGQSPMQYRRSALHQAEKNRNDTNLSTNQHMLYLTKAFLRATLFRVTISEQGEKHDGEETRRQGSPRADLGGAAARRQAGQQVQLAVFRVHLRL